MTRDRSTRRHSARLIALLVGVMMVLAACGDDGGDGGGGELSEADFVAAYTAICTGVNDDIEALEADTFEEAQAAAVEAQAIVEDGVAELRDLQPPDDIADEADQGTDALAETGEVFGALADADSEEGFAEAAPLIDEALGAAQQSLDPLGITCEDDSEGDGAE